MFDFVSAFMSQKTANISTHVVVDVKKSKISGMVFVKAILVIMKNMKNYFSK